MAIHRLHGTDGIRGFVGDCGGDENPIEKLIFQREISPELFTIIGAATGSVLISKAAIKDSNNMGDKQSGDSSNSGSPNSDSQNSDSPLVVIGWDRREHNQKLVSALQQGLHWAGCKTQLIGEVPTPGLHHSILLSGANAGMMVTASHNPASDSGVKLFDEDGFKSMPELEDLISSEAWGISPTELKEIIDYKSPTTSEMEARNGIADYRRHLKEMFELICESIGINTEEISNSLPKRGILLDCSGGAATDWLSFGLTRRGIICEEVSDRERDINDRCGAGELNPTESWSYQHLMESENEHLLLTRVGDILRENDGMAPWKNGDLVAAALDGDGDRCLLLVATEEGISVIDGDQMAIDWLTALHKSGREKMVLAHTIESDLQVPATAQKIGTVCHQTAIGDRWLSQALRSTLEDENGGTSIPPICGCEDSGHIVLPTPHPINKSTWKLVGDGIISLLTTVIARASLGPAKVEINRGWKRRDSIKGVERKRWTGKNELCQRVVHLSQTKLGGSLTRRTIPGEQNLLLLEGVFEGVNCSIAVRNSGTEAKTSVTVKTSTKKMPLDDLVDAIASLLSEELIPTS